MNNGSNSMLDKLALMKVLGQDKEKSGSTPNMMEMMQMMMMLKFMNAPPQSQGMDSSLLLMMMAMQGKGGDGHGGIGVKDIKELMELSQSGKGEDQTTQILMQMLEQQNKDREEDTITTLKREIEELRDKTFSRQFGGGDDRSGATPLRQVEESLDMVERLSSTMQERGLAPPRSKEELEREQRLQEFGLQKDITISEIRERSEERKDLKDILMGMGEKFDRKLEILLSHMTQQQRNNLAAAHPELSRPLYEPTEDDLAAQAEERARRRNGKPQTQMSEDLDDIG